MRLYPPAPAVTGRRAAADDEICGTRIAAGDRVMTSTWVLHRHRALWDRPETFDPDRFSPEASQGRHRFAYMPFGAGPRICIGNSFALMEMVYAFAMAAKRFTLEQPTDEEIPATFAGTTRPTRTLYMNVTERK